MAATAMAQETRAIQVPPIKTTDNVKHQTAAAVQSALPIKTADNVSPQQSKTVQVTQVAVPVRKTNAAGTVQSVNTAIQNKTSTSSKLQPPSSVSVQKAMEQSQKTNTAVKKMD